MINIDFNKSVKALGAKWDGAKWVAGDLTQDEFKALDQQYNQDLVVVELTITDENRDPSSWLGNANAAAICGYVLATAIGRDSGASPHIS